MGEVHIFGGVPKCYLTPNGPTINSLESWSFTTLTPAAPPLWKLFPLDSADHNLTPGWTRSQKGLHNQGVIWIRTIIVVDLQVGDKHAYKEHNMQ